MIFYIYIPTQRKCILRKCMPNQFYYISGVIIFKKSKISQLSTNNTTF